MNSIALMTQLRPPGVRLNLTINFLQEIMVIMCIYNQSQKFTQKQFFPRNSTEKHPSQVTLYTLYIHVYKHIHSWNVVGEFCEQTLKHFSRKKWSFLSFLLRAKHIKGISWKHFHYFLLYLFNMSLHVTVKDCYIAKKCRCHRNWSFI